VLTGAIAIMLLVKIRNQKGAAALEFALVLPLLIMLLMGIIGFGTLYNNYLAITHAAEEGARLAVVGQYSESAVRDAAFPVDPSSVSLTYPEGQTHGKPARVAVTYTYILDIPFFGTKTIPLQSRAEMRLEVP